MLTTLRKSWKLLLTFFTSCALVFTLWPAAALAAPGDTGTTDIWKWSVTSDDKLIITGCTAPTGDLTIPATLDCGSLGTLSVTQIGSSAFNGTAITSIIISDGVWIINSGAFASCTNLASVSLPTSLTMIGFAAFYQTAITSLAIPEGMENVGSGAFGYCASLASVSLPASLKTIGSQAFVGTGLTSVTIPDGVTSIGNYAFSDCASLASVSLPASLKTIGDGAFRYCTSLTGAVLPASLTAIGDSAFLGTAITEITIPSGVTVIGDACFQDCSNLTKAVVLSDTVAFNGNPFVSTGLSSDGFYGNDGSTAQGFASANSFPFHLLLKLSASPSSLQSYTGGRVTVTPNTPGGTWSYDPALLSLNGNEFTGLKPGTAHLTYTADWQSQSIVITIAPALALSSSQPDNHIYTGGRVTVTPSISGGTWCYDPTMLSLSGNEFSGLKAGMAQVTYTVGSQSQSLDIVIAQTLALSPSQPDNHIYTGGRITLTPNIPGGTWSYDSTLLSRTGNEFTPLAAGTAHVTYTAGEQSRSFDIVIAQAALPQTGQDFSPALWLLLAGAASGFAAVLCFVVTRRKRHSRQA